TKEFREERRLPDGVILRRRHAIEFTVERNKIDRNVLTSAVSKADELSESWDHRRRIFQHASEDRPEAIAGQIARMMLLKQSGAAIPNCNSFSPSVVGGDQVDMSALTDFVL